MRLRYKQFACSTLSIILWLAVAYSVYFHHISTQEILTSNSRAVEPANDALLPPSDDAYTVEWTTDNSITTDNSTNSNRESLEIAANSVAPSFLSKVSQPSKKVMPGSKLINPISVESIIPNPVTAKPVAEKRNQSTSVKSAHIPGKVTKDPMDEYSDMGGIAVRRFNSSSPINPHPFQFTLNPEKTCDVGPSCQLFLIVYVHTRPNNIKQRELIRSTWGDVRNYDVTVRVVFVMGLPEGEYVQEAIKLESGLYHDIVQENFLDTYRNLTYKAVGALRWVKDYCSNAQFVLKTDDDAFVNMHVLLDLLVPLHKRGIYGPRSLICNTWYKSPVDRKGKWRVTFGQRKHPTWPNFCQGLAFIITPSVASDMYDASFHVPFLWMDDVFVTGFLAKKIGMSHTQIAKHFFMEDQVEREKMNAAFWKNLYFSHIHKPDLWRWSWKKVTALRNKSSTLTTIGSPCLGSVGCRPTGAVASSKPAFPTRNSYQ